MSKYVIDTTLDNVKKVIAMGVTKGGAIWTDTTDIENLEELNSDYINEHFGELQDTAYQKGLAEGREQMPCDTCAYRHNELLCADCKWNYGSRYKVDSIGAGDVVIYNGTTKCIVVRPEDDERYASLIDSDGTHYSADHRECKKTGRHFDIQSILEEMRHD